jgi:hypothetical protein
MQILVVEVLDKMFKLRKVFVYDLFEISGTLKERLPLFHFTLKFLFYLNFFVSVLQIFSGTLDAEELLLMVWASFHVTVVDLNIFTTAVA